MSIKKTKLAFLALLLLVISAAGTNAFYSDQETSEGNAFSAGTLMTDLRSGQSNFVSNPLDMEPGDSVARDIYVQKNGSLDMNYRATVEVLPGSDVELCEALELKAYHNTYNAPPLFPGDHSNRTMSLEYDGYLDNLDITNNFNGLLSYFFNIFFADNEHWYYYRATLPAGSSATLENKTCNFNVKVSAWQIGGAQGSGFHDVATLESTIATGDWAPEMPTGMRILDHAGADLGCGGVTDNRSMTIDWDDNTEPDLAYYQLDIKDKDDHKRPVVSQYPATIRNLDGFYKYRVRAVDAAGHKSAPTPWCELELDRRTAENLVVINEFIPDPVGADNAAKPNGEWVELYNNGSFSFDLAGWALYDANDTHELIISTSNSDNDGNPFDGGETTIAAGGKLVVYRNGDADFELDNTGDTVRLFNDQILTGGTLVDGHSFAGGFAEGKSFARSPEGTGSFVDPIPTPGRANVFNLGDLSADAKAWRSGTNYLHVGIFDGLNYDQAQINVVYDRDEAGGTVADALSHQVAIDRNNLYILNLYFGTGSRDVLYPHLNVRNVQVEVILSGSGMPDRRIEINL